MNYIKQSIQPLHYKIQQRTRKTQNKVGKKTFKSRYLSFRWILQRMVTLHARVQYFVSFSHFIFDLNYEFSYLDMTHPCIRPARCLSISALLFLYFFYVFLCQKVTIDDFKFKLQNKIISNREDRRVLKKFLFFIYRCCNLQNI